MTKWQFNVLFFVGVGGAVLLLIGPEMGLSVADNPTAFTGVGLILTYILTQKRPSRKADNETSKKEEGEDDGV